METNYKVDRAGWASGPWDDEPDRVEWRSPESVPCLMVRSEITGALCGYAAVPPGHAWYGREYKQLDVDVHGGLTYADFCAGAICHVAQPGESDEVWWLGFDCAHAFDVSPGIGAALHSLDARFTTRGECCEGYRTVAYVREQVEWLAAQIAAATAR